MLHVDYKNGNVDSTYLFPGYLKHIPKVFHKELFQAPDANLGVFAYF